jgi:heavy metal translocating P-type ATPase
VSRRVAALAFPAAALAAIVLGFVVRAGDATAGARVWTAGLVLTGLPVVWKTLRGLVRGHFAADVVASLAIVTAFLLSSPLPGLIVVLMQTGGEALERYAEGRASNAVRELEARAPTIARRVVDGVTQDIPVDQIVPGDTLLVRPGELIPCDGMVREGESAVDATRLTGEAAPVDARPGTRLMSGSANGSSPLTITALARANESQYARIVDLVRSAQASKAPFQRLADRYAVWFTPGTLLVCVAAYAVSSDWQRVLAVLVVATPCPLILAAPVAIIGGINRAARQMIIFRTGGALEELGGVTAAVFDKTGTLTTGRPEVGAIIPANGLDPNEALRLASAVEEYSNHPMARTLVEEAVRRRIVPPAATAVTEAPGRGVDGMVGGRLIVVGGRSWIAERFPGPARELDALASAASGVRSYVVVDGRAAAVIEYEDRIRFGIETLVTRMRSLGVSPLILLSGDHEENAESVARSVGLDTAEGDLLPADKARRVTELQQAGHRVVMLGDGTNDAPALSTADVGVALASGGGGISAEAADIVLLADDPSQLGEAIAISRGTLRIARQSVWTGLGLSVVAMGFAAAGLITPIAGALIQEGIDVAVILNALRAATTGSAFHSGA